MIEIIKPKTHEAWLQVRQGGIGSSEIASVLGINPFQSPLQLWLIKTKQVEKQEENFAMKAGHYLEDAVSQFWEDATGLKVIKSSAGDWLMRNSDKPYLQVSPDRLYWTNQGRSYHDKGILECKTTQRQILPEDVPNHWFCQLQYQLGVAELKHGSLAWLTAGRDFGYRDFVLDEEFFKFLEEEAVRFWVDNVMGNKAPEISSVNDIKIMFPSTDPTKTIDADADCYDKVVELREIKHLIGTLTEKKEALEDYIKLQMKDAEALLFKGETIATWKQGKELQKFDYNLYQKEHPDLVEPYLRTQEGVRRFTLK